MSETKKKPKDMWEKVDYSDTLVEIRDILKEFVNVYKKHVLFQAEHTKLADANQKDVMDEAIKQILQIGAMVQQNQAVAPPIPLIRVNLEDLMRREKEGERADGKGEKDHIPE
jgi:hypothetical protein